jgi:hypothetical protein
MNGERVLVVLESRPTNDRYGEGTVHEVLHVTGRKAGRVMVFTEPATTPWEAQSNMLRLDA